MLFRSVVTTVAFVRVDGLIIDVMLPLPITTGTAVVLEADDEPADESLELAAELVDEAELAELVGEEDCAEDAPLEETALLVVETPFELATLDGAALVCDGD